MTPSRLMLLALSVCCLSTSAQAEKLPLIFNGKNLDGWVAPENNKVWFRADDGILKVESGPDKKGQTLWTKDSYKDFVMEFDFKFGHGTVDTGIYVRNTKEQIQIGISGSLKVDMTGSPYISGKGYPKKAEVEKILKLKDWNHMTIVARGKNYCVWLNGKHVMTYDSDSAIEKGPVGIQLHGSRDMSCEYRDIRLAELR